MYKGEKTELPTSLLLEVTHTLFSTVSEAFSVHLSTQQEVISHLKIIQKC